MKFSAGCQAVISTSSNLALDLTGTSETRHKESEIGFQFQLLSSSFVQSSYLGHARECAINLRPYILHFS